VKIAPLLAAMRSYKDIEPMLVHKGQHYDKKLSRFSSLRWGFQSPISIWTWDLDPKPRKQLKS